MRSTVSTIKFVRETLRRTNKEPRCIWASDKLGVGDTISALMAKRLSRANARDIVDELKFPQ